MADEFKTRKTRLRRKATVHDVARLAGVSIATVSRSLNNPDTVRPALRKRVSEAATELGYYANSIGKALRHQRSRLIGTMLPKLFDPLFSLVGSGVQETLVEHDYLGFLQVSGLDNRDLMRHAEPMIKKGAEGLIVFGQIEDEELLDYCQQRNIPLLSIYSFIENSQVPSIGFDNYAASAELVNFLVELGHVHVAMISGYQLGNDRQQARVKSYADTMRRLNKTPIVEEIGHEFGILDGAAALQRILDRSPETTAIICTRVAHALSAMKECRQRGLVLPRDLSIASFDDLEYTSFLDPPLTSIEVPAYEIGRQAAEAMLYHLEKGWPLRSVKVETRLVVRGSTVRPDPRRPLLKFNS